MNSFPPAQNKLFYSKNNLEEIEALFGCRFLPRALSGLQVYILRTAPVEATRIRVKLFHLVSYMTCCEAGGGGQYKQN